MFKYHSTPGGARDIRKLPLDSSTAAIVAGTVMKVGTAGYFQDAGAGDNAIGVATQDAAVPGSDGAGFCLVDVSPFSKYTTTAGTGTIVAAMAQQVCDLAAASTLDVTASTDDCIVIHEVNVADATALVSISPIRAGVV